MLPPGAVRCHSYQFDSYAQISVFLLDESIDFQILSESDIVDEDDGEDLLEDGRCRTTATTTTCCNGLSLDSGKPADGTKDINNGDNNNHNYDNDDCAVNSDNDDVEMQRPKTNHVQITNTDESPCVSNDDGCDDNHFGNDDIEMQGSKSNVQEEVRTDDNGSTISECDDLMGRRRTVFVPLPGQKVAECQGNKGEPLNCDHECGSTTKSIETTKTQRHHPQQQQRAYSDGCAVCLNPFEVNQKVTWSSNPDCPHVYHHQCLLEWFVAVGTRDWKTRAGRHDIGTGNDLESSMESMRKEICDFVTLCPCTRQDFFLEGNKLLGDFGQGSTDHDSNSSTNNTTTVSLSDAASEEDELEEAENN